MPRCQPRHYGRHWYVQVPYHRVFLSSARLNCDQTSVGSLAGFSIPSLLLSCRWPRSRYSLYRSRWDHLLRWSRMIHVKFGLVLGPPPRGTHIDFDSAELGPSCQWGLDIDHNVDFDILYAGQYRTENSKIARTTGSVVGS
jgi:hypothetical protein